MITYYTPTPAEQRLIDALRSGEFEQGRDVLERNGKNCCLGVACRVSDVPLRISRGAPGGGAVGFNNSFFHLPEDVRRELGWATDTGMLRILSRDMSEPELTELNDGGFTFDQIADLIEWGAVLREGETC